MNTYNDYILYYREIEKTFLETENYVAIDTINFKTYSVKYNWLYQSICSEIGVIFKAISRVLDVKKCNDIKEYYILVHDFFPLLLGNEVAIELRNISFSPFEEWTKTESPEWWRMYNKIKHNRDCLDNNEVPYYKHATLENVLNSLAALYLLENYLIVFSEKDYSNAARKMLAIKGDMFVCSDWKSYYQGFLGQKLFPYEKFVAWLREEGVKC